MSFTVDADFAGGNLIVEEIAGDTITCRQDIRDTTEWWFYWCCRVKGAAGRTLTFRFTDGNVFGARGPAFSTDGWTWRWLGAEAMLGEDSFRVVVPPDGERVFLSFCIPYVEAHLRRFLAGCPYVRRDSLGLTEGGREIDHLHIPSARGAAKVLLTARHHACEAMANYVLEGVMAFWGTDQPDAALLRAYVDLHVVPFVDKDGVEQGDQGKSRAPHDHNRDYTDAPIHASVRAVRAAHVTWPGAWAAMLDVHCPWIRGGYNDTIFFIGPEPPHDVPVTAFARRLAETARGPLPFDPDGMIRHGVDWNTGLSATCACYFRAQPDMPFAATLEFPYALASGHTVTIDGARAFGMDLGRALAEHTRALMG